MSCYFLKLRKESSLCARHDTLTNFDLSQLPQQWRNNDNNYRDDVREHFLSDSWFASIVAEVNIWQKFQSDFIGFVKTPHAGYCRKFLEDKMEEWPAGSHLILQLNVDGVGLVAIGYKHNKRKVTYTFVRPCVCSWMNREEN